jgi:hypothetical protein
MAQPAIECREKDLLTAAERELVEAFRARVRELGLPKLSEGELAMCRHRRANAEVSSAIEGLPLWPAQRAFFDMIEEERVGVVSDELVIEFCRALWRLRENSPS